MTILAKKSIPDQLKYPSQYEINEVRPTKKNLDEKGGPLLG